MKLTGKTIAGLALPSGKDDQIFWDDDPVGFGVRIRGASTRQFIVQYRSDGHTRRVKIGALGVLSVEQARAEAKKILASVALGDDPQAERREKKLARSIPSPTSSTPISRRNEMHGARTPSLRSNAI